MNYNKIIVYTDGGARGNPGPAAVGVVIEGDGKFVVKFGKRIGASTNNTAEYTGVIEAFNYLIKQGSRGEVIEVLMDSLLVVQQLSGKFKIKQPHLKKLWTEVKASEKKVGERVVYVHIPREKNKEADRLVNEVLDKEPGGSDLA